MRRLLAGGAALLLGGCWAWGPQGLEAQAERALAEHPGTATLARWAQEARAQASPRPDWRREGELFGLALGLPGEALRRRWGQPTEGGQRPEGSWRWRHPEAGAAIAELAGSPAVVRRWEAWAPAPASTWSQLRPGDDAARVLRKYGPELSRRPWGLRGAELWLVPQANLAFVVGPATWVEGEAVPRRVLAVMVGGFADD